MVLHLHLRNGIHLAEDVVTSLLRLGGTLLGGLVSSDGIHIAMLLQCFLTACLKSKRLIEDYSKSIILTSAKDDVLYDSLIEFYKISHLVRMQE